ncbi:MAG: helix-turn-helix domain-containing protein [Thermomicrobiales bacterium]
MDDYLTTAEVAAKLRVNPETVKVWLRTGKLKGFVLSDRAGWRVPRAEVELFVEERMKHGAITQNVDSE